MATTIGTVPSTAPNIDGPFMITAYGFSGHSVRYVQVANVSKTLAVLDSWKLRATWGTSSWELAGLNGTVAPGKKVTIANSALMPTATFPFSQTEVAAEPFLDALSLIPPAGSGYNNHVVDTTVKTSTVRDTSTQPASFYLQRNVSNSTGDFLSAFTAFSVRPSTIESDPLYVPLVTSPLQIVEIYPNAVSCSPVAAGDGCSEYVKLFNATSGSVDMSNFRLRTGTSVSSSGVTLMGVLSSGSYAPVHITLNDTGGYVWLEDTYGQRTYGETTVSYPSASSFEGSAWSYNLSKDGWQWTKLLTPSNMANRFADETPVNRCEGVRLSEIGANDDEQFIEIYNSTNDAVDISGCQLQTNRSDTAEYSFAGGTILGGDSYLSVPIRTTSLTLTKTTSGTVFLLSSDALTEIDARSYENLDDGTSLSLIGGVWQQTFALTPGEQNIYEQYPPCETGYARDDATGRCNKIVIAASLTPCDIDEYRSPDTNRCRKVVATASTGLAACGEGQERNPATNRCRSIASAVAELLPCDEGYERNPATNRCRKVAGVSTTAGATAASIVEQAKGSSWDAWTWALVAVGATGAIGYGVYEWRHELLGFGQKVASRFGKK